MGKGKSGHKPNNAAKRNRARYKLEGRRAKNKARKARKEAKKREKREAKNKRRNDVMAKGMENE